MAIRMSDEMLTGLNNKELRHTALVYAIQYMSASSEWRDHRGAEKIIDVAKVFEEYLK